MKLSDEEIEYIRALIRSKNTLGSDDRRKASQAIRQLMEERDRYRDKLKEVSRCMSYNAAVIIAKQALGEDDGNEWS